jgi:phosphatidylserine decarboxylase
VRFAREGRLFIIVSALLAIVALSLAVQRGGAWWVAAIVLALLASWVAYFFRDPEREGERGERLVLAPADGKVVLITEVDEPTFLEQRGTRISIFMNVFSVHVNRYPVSGTVQYVQYVHGKFLNAVSEQSSAENEQSSVGIDTGRHRVLMRQIAGLIARRIITYSRSGDRAEQGARMGLIRFGSRVDVFVPLGSTVKVKLGDETVAGSTVIAELPPVER